MRILLVCLGNICRSPMAEGILRRKAEAQGLDWTIDSAGTESYHVGQPPHPHSQKVCQLNGIDISGQRARRFIAADLYHYDKVYAMAEDVLDEIRRIGGRKAKEEHVLLFLDELYPGAHASVPDPWYGKEEDFTEAFDLINQACDAIIRKYGHLQAAKP